MDRNFGEFRFPWEDEVPRRRLQRSNSDSNLYIGFDSGIGRSTSYNPILDDERNSDGSNISDSGESNSDNDADDNDIMAQDPPKMNGAHMSQVPRYAGEEGQACLNWLEQMNSVGTLVGWNNEQKARLGMIKLDGPAADWIRAEKIMGNLPDSWDDVEAAVGPPVVRAAIGIHNRIKNRFGKTKTTATAVDAIMNLRQKQGESVSTFYDRVRLAVDEKNYKTTEAEKTVAAYQKSLAEDTKIFLLAGLKDDLRNRVLGVPNPPDSLTDVMTILRAAEAEIGASKHVNIMMNETNNDQTDNERQVAQLNTRGNFRGRTRGTTPLSAITCFNCNNKGHYQSECRQPNRNRPSNRGRGGQFRPRQPNGGWQPPIRGAPPYRGRGRGVGVNQVTEQQSFEQYQQEERDAFYANQTQQAAPEQTASENCQGGLWESHAAP